MTLSAIMEMKQRRYKNVGEDRPLMAAAADSGGGDDSSSRAWLEFAWQKLFALLWISVAVGIGYVIELPEVVMHGHAPSRPHRRMNRFLFNVALAGFVGWLLIAAYLIVWVKYIKRVATEWEEYAPRAIPVATICAVGSLFAFCAAFWPVWSVLSLPIVFFLFLGALNLAHFVPL